VRSDLDPRRGGGALIARRAQKEQLRSGKAVRAGVTRHGSDAQHKTGGEVGIGLVRPWMRAGVFYQ
jgi:hypothetical protein